MYLETERINYKNRLNNIYLPKARFLIESLMKSKKFKNIKKRPQETLRSLANIAKIKRILKWKPQITIEKGIATILK